MLKYIRKYLISFLLVIALVPIFINTAKFAWKACRSSGIVKSNAILKRIASHKGKRIQRLKRIISPGSSCFLWSDPVHGNEIVTECLTAELNFNLFPSIVEYRLKDFKKFDYDYLLCPPDEDFETLQLYLTFFDQDDKYKIVQSGNDKEMIVLRKHATINSVSSAPSDTSLYRENESGNISFSKFLFLALCFILAFFAPCVAGWLLLAVSGEQNMRHSQSVAADDNYNPNSGRMLESRVEHICIQAILSFLFGWGVFQFVLAAWVIIIGTSITFATGSALLVMTTIAAFIISKCFGSEKMTASPVNKTPVSAVSSGWAKIGFKNIASRIAFLLIVAILAILFISIFIESLMDTNSYPMEGVWGYKTLILSEGGNNVLSFLTSPKISHAHPTYPLAFPSLLAWCSVCAGRFSPVLLKLVPPILWFAIFAVMIFFVTTISCIKSRIKKKWGNLVNVFMAVIIPAIFLILPWRFFLLINNIQVGDFKITASFAFAEKIEILKQSWIKFFSVMFMEPGNIYGYGWFWYFLLLVLAFGGWKRLKGSWCFFIPASAGIAFFIMVYIFSNRPLEWHLGAVPRLLIVPATLLFLSFRPDLNE